ncbi:MAG TPA: GNAT family protein [Candidatus Limnocylindria bacterium]|jgi:RimJ/RimL family protein N-acetyltransferase|nr:GNAT family protein [Candidatus Limnocylindria bacterium]
MSASLNSVWPVPQPVSHPGRFISLSPLDVERDGDELFALSHGDEKRHDLWRYLPIGPFPHAEAMRVFLRDLRAMPGLVPFTVRETATGRCLGSLSIMSIRSEHGVAELGYVWYGPAAQRTKANTESCYLLLRYCFDVLGYRRMEWKCNALNTPSQAAALRMGFQPEGVFRQHMVVKGENRDTSWFSMLDHEWPLRRANFEKWLYEDESVSLSQLNRTAGVGSV